MDCRTLGRFQQQSPEGGSEVMSSCGAGVNIAAAIQLAEEVASRYGIAALKPLISSRGESAEVL